MLLGRKGRLDAVGKKTHLLHLRDTALATDSAKHLLGLAKVNNIDSAAETVLHILNHTANVGDMRTLIVNGLISLILTSKRTSKTHHTGVLALGLDRKHNSRSKLVMSRSALAINLNNVDRIPCTLHRLTLLGLILSLLEEDASSKAIIKIPAVNRGNTTFIIKITIDVKDIIHSNLHLTELSRRHGTIRQGGIIAVRPGATIAISITVIIAQKVITLLLLIVGNLKRLIDSAKKILHKVGNKVDQTSEVVLQLCRRKTTHKIKCTIKLICNFLLKFLYETLGERKK